jgi:hypothetical protein
MTTASHIEPNSSYHENPAPRAVTLGSGRDAKEAGGSFGFDGSASGSPRAMIRRRDLPAMPAYEISR